LSSEVNSQPSNSDPRPPLNKSVVWLASIVYFIQGALGLASIALPLFLRAQGFSITKIAFITSVAIAPWFFKIIYGAISDSCPIMNLRRKPYLIICSILSTCGWILLFLVPADAVWIIFAMTIANLGLAATDVITDGLVVENSEKGTTQIYQSISWGARSVGALLAGISGGYLASKLDYRVIFLITGVLPLFSLYVSIKLDEKPAEIIKSHNIIRTMVESFRYIINSELIWFCLLTSISALPVSYGIPLFFKLKETLQFQEILLGALSSIAWFGAIIGCLFYIKFFKNMKLSTALYWSIGISSIQTLMALAIQNVETACIISLSGGIIGYISLLPFFSANAKLCHGTGLEGSLFAIVASVFNLSQAIFRTLGSYLSELIGLDLTIVVTAVLCLLGFLVIPKLKSL